MKPELDNELMMVVTRGQTGRDGPVTPTARTAAPVRHNPNAMITSEIGSAGRYGEHVASTDPTARAANGTQTSQAETTTRSTQMGSTLRSGLPWLPTDDESGMEPEDPYSQGDRPDPLKTEWERTVGGKRRLAPPRVMLVLEAECREGRILDSSSWRACDEPRLYRERAPVTNASSGVTPYGTDRSCTADYGEPEIDGYLARDPWNTQSQSGRPCPETVWGYRTSNTAMSRGVQQCPLVYLSRSEPMLLRPGKAMPYMGPDVSRSLWMPQTLRCEGKGYWCMGKDYGGKK